MPSTYLYFSSVKKIQTTTLIISLIFKFKIHLVLRMSPKCGAWRKGSGKEDMVFKVTTVKFLHKLRKKNKERKKTCLSLKRK